MEVGSGGEEQGLADATEKLALAASTGKTVHESSESLFVGKGMGNLMPTRDGASARGRSSGRGEFGHP